MTTRDPAHGRPSARWPCRSPPCGRRPEAPRDLDEAAVATGPTLSAWADSMDQDVTAGPARPHPDPAADGEPVQVLEAERDGLVAGRARSGSASSRRRERLPGLGAAAPPGHARGPCHRATAFVIDAHRACTPGRRRRSCCPSGTVLWVDAMSERSAHVHLPDGGRAGPARARPARACTRAADLRRPGRPCSAAARQFLGVRYLWGGTSALGAGLLRTGAPDLPGHGVLLPRDAHDQAAADQVEPVAAGRREPGDLYFFARPGAADLPRRVRHQAGRDRRHALDAPCARGRRAGRGRADGTGPPGQVGVGRPGDQAGRRPGRLSRTPTARSVLGRPARAATRAGGRCCASSSSCAFGFEAIRLATVVTARMPTMAPSETRIGMSGAHADGLAAVDERQLVLVHRVQDQLDAR